MTRRDVDDAKLRGRDMLSRQLLVLVAFYSLVLSLPIGLANLWIGQRHEAARQQEQVEAVRSLFGTQLRHAVWNFDEPSVRRVLSGLSHFPALQSVEVESPDMHASYVKPGTQIDAAEPVQRYPLKSPEGDMVIGQMTLRLDRAALHERAWDEVQKLVLVLGIELVVLVVLIFSLMERSVTLPVLALSRHVRDMTPERLDQPAPLPDTRRPNELHELARGVTRLQSALRDQLAQRDAIAHTLQQSEARLRLIADSIPNHLWTLRPDGTLDYASQRALEFFGLTSEQLLGAKWRALVHPDDMPECNARWTKSFATGAPFHMDLRLRRFDGEYRWHEALAVAQHDDAGAVLKWFGSSVDITERKRSEEALLQSQKMNAIGSLAGGIAHDFNNQLVAILGFAELLDRQLEGASTKSLTAGILAAANRCRDLTKNLLAFSRKRQVERVAVDVHQLIVETLHLLERSLDKRIHVTRHLNARTAVVRGDPSQLQNALLNLALNARDAMPGGGLIDFGTEIIERGSPGHPYLAVSVRDTGTGMSEQVKRRLFEPFFTTKAAGEGTGMGLASVHGTVESHGGTISVDTEVGRGTTFWMFLPIAELRQERHGAPVRGDVKKIAPQRVLVIDDDAGVREVVARSLRAAGHAVRTAASGEEALQTYEKEGHEIDLVVLDMMMPGLGGLETFRALRAIQPSVKVLLCSGFGVQGATDTLLEAGAVGFLQKPFEQRQLHAAIAAAVGEAPSDGLTSGHA